MAEELAIESEHLFVNQILSAMVQYFEIEVLLLEVELVVDRVDVGEVKGDEWKLLVLGDRVGCTI